MAAISEIVLTITAEGGSVAVGELNKVSQAQANVAAGSKKIGTESKNGFSLTNNSLVEFGQKWQGVMAAVSTAAIPVMATIGAIKKTVEFSREGAELQFMEDRFDSLASSINTTGTALMYDLRAASRGMMDDSALMKGATDLMALGLVSTREEAARLTSVIGSLGWNMDQLTMSITNETTRRLDTLGLSVESVKKRYEELKKSGVEGQQAMMIAITEAGEAMIALGGHVADSPLGQWKAMEAAQKTYFDNLKKSLSDSVEWWAKFWTAQFEFSNTKNYYDELIQKAKEYGLVLEGLPSVLSNTGSMGSAQFDPEKAQAAIKILVEMIDAHEQGLAAEEAFGASMAAGYKARTDAAKGILPVYGEIKSSIEGIFTNSSQMNEKFMSDWTAMSQMARDYDGVLKQIAANDKNIEQLNQIINGTATEFNGTKMSVEEAKGKLEELLGVGEELKGMFDDIAKQMTLSMLQSTFSVDGYSRAEIDALLNYMIEAGMITAEAAEMMKKNYILAVEEANKVELETKIGEIKADYEDYLDGAEYVNGKIIDPKTGAIIADLTNYRAGLDEVARTKFDDMIVKLILDASAVNNYQPERKTGYVDYMVGSVPTFNPPNYNVPVDRAIGGPTYPGQLYNWQEPGREGELFMPSQYGRVLSATEVTSILRNATTTTSNNNQEQMVVNNNYYTINNNYDVNNELDLMRVSRKVAEMIGRSA